MDAAALATVLATISGTPEEDWTADHHLVAVTLEALEAAAIAISAGMFVSSLLPY